MRASTTGNHLISFFIGGVWRKESNFSILWESLNDINFIDIFQGYNWEFLDVPAIVKENCVISDLLEFGVSRGGGFLTHSVLPSWSSDIFFFFLTAE